MTDLEFLYPEAHTFVHKIASHWVHATPEAEIHTAALNVAKILRSLKNLKAPE